ncbi:MAG: hypothetical protein EB069_05445, partial [Actinobacteria bacterium]|nr:hypothetical protein [Actinomycetota bacterium]
SKAAKTAPYDLPTEVRQPYLAEVVPQDHHLNFPEAEHIHFFGFYIGNFPTLELEEVKQLCSILNAAL